MFFLVLFFVSCKKEKSNGPANTELDNFHSGIIFNNDVKKFTPIILKLGIQDMQLESVEENNFILKLIAGKNVILNGEKLNLNAKQIKISESLEAINLIYSNNITIVYNKKTNSKEIKYNKIDKNILLADVTDESFDRKVRTEIQIGVLLMRELVDNQAFRMLPSTFDIQAKKDGTWYTVNTAFSRSVLHEQLTNEVNQFLADNPECKKVGSIDISCVTDEHICVGTQYYDCGLPTME